MKLGFLLIFFCLFLTTIAISQPIKGTVSTYTGAPVPAATISVLNSTKGASADKDGRFTLVLGRGDYQLSISAVGYATQFKSITIGDKGTPDLAIQLQPVDRQLNEVVVTAEKKQENVQKVPAAVSVLDAKQIRDYRIWDITNLTAIAPSLFVIEHGNSASANFFNIRGVMGFSNEQAVATYVDGVYQFDYFSAPAQFGDVQSVEVLRGPQGTLYGRNAFGGVVNITTKQPGNTLAGYLETTVGNYGQQRYTASLSGPIENNKLFVGGSFTYNHRSSIYYNEFTHSGYDRREDYSGNFNVRYLPSANWSLALNLKTENDNDRGSYPWLSNYDSVFAKPYRVNSNNVNIERRNNFNTTLAANYYGKDFNFSAVSSYIDYHLWYPDGGVDYDFSPLNIFSVSPDTRQHIFSEEIRFSSPSARHGRLQWVAGAYGFTQKIGMNFPTYYGSDYLLLDSTSDAPFTISNISKGTNKGYAFFGQATYSLSDKWDFTAGIRYDYENRKLSQYSNYQKDPNPATQIAPNQDYTAGFHAVTPKFVLSYKPEDNILLYASYARGFRSGGLNTNAPTPALVPYEPEHSDNYEIGWKNMLLDNKLKLNLTFFYLEQHNQQINTSMDGLNNLVLNVGEMHNKGVELEVTALPVKGLQIDWNASYSHARYTSLLLYSAADSAVVNYKGNQPINNPPVSSMLAVQYTYNFAGSKQGLSAFVRGEYRYLSKYYFDFINGYDQPSYSLFNVKAGVSIRHFELDAWMRNVGDKKYIPYGSFGTFLLGAPRTYGITLIAKI